MIREISEAIKKNKPGKVLGPDELSSLHYNCFENELSQPL